MNEDVTAIAFNGTAFNPIIEALVACAAWCSMILFKSNTDHALVPFKFVLQSVTPRKMGLSFKEDTKITCYMHVLQSTTASFDWVQCREITSHNLVVSFSPFIHSNTWRKWSVQVRQVRDTAAPYCVVRHRHEASPDECIVQYYSLNNDKKSLLWTYGTHNSAKKRSLSFVAACKQIS